MGVGLWDVHALEPQLAGVVVVLFVGPSWYWYRSGPGWFEFSKVLRRKSWTVLCILRVSRP